MSTFDKREEGFEKKYALDEEQKFKAEARRNRLLGTLGSGKAWQLRATPPRPTPRKWLPPISRKPATPTCSARCLKDLTAKGLARHRRRASRARWTN